MRAVVVFKENTDYARDVLTYLEDFRRATGRQLETLDPESPAGIMFTETYDLMQFPAIIALSDDGQMQNRWIGLPLPTISEVSYYA